MVFRRSRDEALLGAADNVHVWALSRGPHVDASQPLFRFFPLSNDSLEVQSSDFAGSSGPFSLTEFRKGPRSRHELIRMMTPARQDIHALEDGKLELDRGRG